MVGAQGEPRTSCVLSEAVVNTVLILKHLDLGSPVVRSQETQSLLSSPALRSLKNSTLDSAICQR